jgi:hypothetical protein
MGFDFDRCLNLEFRLNLKFHDSRIKLEAYPWISKSSSPT